jgi:hypothetical protein
VFKWNEEYFMVFVTNEFKPLNITQEITRSQISGFYFIRVHYMVTLNLRF